MTKSVTCCSLWLPILICRCTTVQIISCQPGQPLTCQQMVPHDCLPWWWGACAKINRKQILSVYSVYWCMFGLVCLLPLLQHLPNHPLAGINILAPIARGKRLKRISVFDVVTQASPDAVLWCERSALQHFVRQCLCRPEIRIPVHDERAGKKHNDQRSSLHCTGGWRRSWGRRS